MALLVPNYNVSLVNGAGQVIAQAWRSFFQQFVQAPSAILPITLTASPFSYTAVEPGNLAISGGTISAITLTRGTTVITLATSAAAKLVPVAIGDIVTITYSILPTLQFIPSY